MIRSVLSTITLIVVVFLSSIANAQPPKIEGKAWEKVEALSDEFEGKKINEEKWNIDPKGHYELDCIGHALALFQKKSFGIANGYLTIEVDKLPKPTVVGKEN